MQTHPFETILVPTDFSEISAHALRLASLIRARCGANITAVYSDWFEVPLYFTAARVAELQAEFRDSLHLAEETLDAFVRSTLAGDAKSVSLQVVEALPADGIQRVAAQTHSDLIVIGTHGRSGWNRWMLGSVAERVLRESQTPVLTVRSSPPENIRHVLCPVNDTDVSRRALTLAVSMSACFDATVTVLHVHEPSGTAPVSDLCSWIPAAERTKCNVRELALHGANAAEEIVKLTSQEPYDLVVLGAPHRRFFDGMFLGTTTIRTVRHATCPVLTVPSGD